MKRIPSALSERFAGMALVLSCSLASAAETRDRVPSAWGSFVRSKAEGDLSGVLTEEQRQLTLSLAKRLARVVSELNKLKRDVLQASLFTREDYSTLLTVLNTRVERAWKVWDELQTASRTTWGTRALAARAAVVNAEESFEELKRSVQLGYTYPAEPWTASRL